MSFKFWCKEKEKEEQKEKKAEVDAYVLVSVCNIQGALGFSTPTVFGMRPFLDTLDKIPRLNSDKSENVVYRPIGVLYEAIVVNKEKE